jgi:hypothetical protein
MQGRAPSPVCPLQSADSRAPLHVEPHRPLARPQVGAGRRRIDQEDLRQLEPVEVDDIPGIEFMIGRRRDEDLALIRSAAVAQLVEDPHLDLVFGAILYRALMAGRLDEDFADEIADIVSRSFELNTTT